MPSILVRDVPEALHRALKQQAKLHKRSTAAEIRYLLEEAVRPAPRLKLGSHLAALGRRVNLSDDEVDSLQSRRDGTPEEPMSFE